VEISGVEEVETLFLGFVSLKSSSGSDTALAFSVVGGVALGPPLFGTCWLQLLQTKKIFNMYCSWSNKLSKLVDQAERLMDNSLRYL
jgi:hypothetical protein